MVENKGRSFQSRGVTVSLENGTNMYRCPDDGFYSMEVRQTSDSSILGKILVAKCRLKPLIPIAITAETLDEILLSPLPEIL